MLAEVFIFYEHIESFFKVFYTIDNEYSSKGVFMKKVICIFLSVIIAFSFAGCTNSANVKKLVNDFIKEINNPLKEIDLSELGNISLLDYSSNDELIAILYAPYIPDEQLDEDYDLKTFLTVYDIKRGRLKKSIETDPNSFTTAFSGDYIQVWSEEQVSVLYDTALNEIGSGKGKSFDCYDKANTVDTIDTKRFVCRDNYAYDSNYINYDIMIFYNDTDNYYINKRSTITNDISGYDKVILDCTHNSDSEITLNVKNYENMTLINSLTLSSESGYCSIAEGIISDEYAIFEFIKNETGDSRLYCWSYNDDAINTSFECTVVNDSNFDNNVDLICRKIKDNYGVNAVLSKSLPEEDTSYKCTDNKTDAQYLLNLYDLEYCLSTFPKQLYDEMLCNDIDDAIAQFNQLSIHIVGEIDDNNISAFAYNMNDELIIVYSCGSFTYSTFCHELMHNIEYRIWNYEPDFDAKWEALNPDDFVYSSEYLDVYYENESYKDYFARDYGISGILEDRATVFEMYYDAQHSKSEPLWKEHEPLSKKVNYLNEVIAKSYPSLSKAA